MDIYINEFESTIQATDTEMLLSPQMMRQIVAAVMAQLREHEAYDERRLRERRLDAGVAARRASWE